MTYSEFIETVKISVDSLKANKMRSFLASLGVVIGISFVIIMGWLLSGLDSAVNDSFKTIGVDMMYIDKWNWAGGKNWKDIRQRKDITIEQVNEFIERVQAPELTFPSARQWGTTVKYYNLTYTGINVTGTSSNHALTPAGEVSEGRHFTPFEDDINANVAVIGTKVNESFFPNGGAVGKTIKINGHKFLVIGVIKKQGTMFLDFLDNQIYVPLGSFLKTFGKFNRSISIGIKAGSEENIDESREEARGIMRSIRNLKPHDEDDFSINETKAFEEQVAGIRLIVWGVGIGMTILSFFVGIIGIMNIMFVSVTERTKEIGIRKAIGAKKSAILMQFIVESTFLCLLGSLISLVFCSILVYAAATFLPMITPNLAFLTPYLSINLLFVASVVSIVVGVLSGLVPAMRAANLDPVESLRFE